MIGKVLIDLVRFSIAIAICLVITRYTAAEGLTRDLINTVVIGILISEVFINRPMGFYSARNDD